MCRKKEIFKKWTEYQWAVGQLQVNKYMCNLSYQEMRESGKGRKKFEKIIAKKFSSLVKIINPQIQAQEK